MPPENIDDLFRDKLDGHASPPGDDLWARLQAHVPAEAAPTPAPAPERLDQLFQKGLSQHATPPRRELWERLEDEHLRPRQRRGAAWWPLAMAAAVALFLLVGGGMWLGSPTGKMSGGEVASQSSQADRGVAPSTATTTKSAPISTPINKDAAAGSQQDALVASAAPETAGQSTISAPVQKNATLQATRSEALASTASKASKAAREQSSRYLKKTIRPLDAPAGSAPQVARNSARPAAQSALPSGTDEHRKALEPAPVVAQAPKPAPAEEIVPATAAELITVDVRAGDARPAKATVSALAAAEAPAERKRLGGRLLQQAGRLVRGEQVNLAELTGLPENVTVRATVAGRTVTKSIQL